MESIPIYQFMVKGSNLNQFLSENLRKFISSCVLHQTTRWCLDTPNLPDTPNVPDTPNLPDTSNLQVSSYTTLTSMYIEACNTLWFSIFTIFFLFFNLI